MRKLILSAAVLLGMAVPVYAQTALEQDITGTGFNQGDLVTLLQNIVDDVNAIKSELNDLGDDVLDVTNMLDTDSGITFTSYTDKIMFSSVQTLDLTLSAP